MSRLSTLALFLSLPVLSIPALWIPAGFAQGQSTAAPPLTVNQAIDHLDQAATVCGPITGQHTAPGVGTLIDLGPSSPKPAFRVVIWNSDRSKVGDLPSSGNICVTGMIGQAQGIPQIVLEDAKSWALSAAPHPAAPAPSTVVTPSKAPAPTTAITTGTAVAPRPSAPTSTTVAPKAAATLRTDATAPPSTAAASAPVPPNSSPANSPEYRIGPDDSLQITVWQEPTLSGTFLVRPDGMISLVLLGDVPAAGRTPMQLAADLTTHLRKFLQDPLVAVTVDAANSQKIYLMGEVQHVGPLEMATTMSPLQAIAAAGGLTPYAKKNKIYILRGPAGKQQKIPFNYSNALKGKPHSSPVLLAGDTIVVP